MAALALTAANILQTSITGIANVTVIGTAGTNITAGMFIFPDTADANKMKLGACTSSSAAVAGGIALGNAATGQPVAWLKQGAVDIGPTEASQGVLYVVGVTNGEINPAADMTSTWYSTFLAYAYSTRVLVIPSGGVISSGRVLS